MKRDFKEEYQDYIDSELPDLWSRIEPNLKEKGVTEKLQTEKMQTEKRQPVEIQMEKEQTETPVKRRRAGAIFYQRMLPAAACLCVLLVGIGAIQLHKNAQNAGNYKNAAGEAVEESAEWTEDTMEESAAAEEEIEESIEENTDIAEEAEEESADVMEESAASADMADETTEESAVEATAQNSIEAATEQTDTSDAAGDMADTAEDTTDTAGISRIQEAVLIKIALASAEMQEKGYSYAYTFRLTDESEIMVYLTGAQCDDMEKQGIEIERQATYDLDVTPLQEDGETTDVTCSSYCLQKIKKLP